MKQLNYVDPYAKSSVTRGSGYQTDNGVIKVIPNYSNDTEALKYITVINHNGMKVHVTASLIPEVIEMLQRYSPSL